MEKSVSNLINEIIKKLIETETGTHDVAFVGLHDPVLQRVYRSVATNDVTFRLLQRNAEHFSLSGRRISLLLLDCSRIQKSKDLSEFMEKLVKNRIWQSKVKVMVFLRDDQVRLMKNIGEFFFKWYGATSVLFVVSKNIQIEYYILKAFNGSYNLVENPIDELFSPKLLNLEQYKFKIFINPATPFHNYFNETHAKGIDAEVVEMIVKHVNGSIKYTKLSVDIHYIVDVTSIVAQRKLFDLSLQYSALFENVDHVWPPNHEQVCVTVPKRHERLMFFQLGKPFSVSVWIFVIVVTCYHLFLKILSIYFFKMCMSQWKTLVKLSNLFAIINQHSKFLTITTDVLCFVLIEAYLAKVITFLATMQYEPNPRTLEDLDRREQPFSVNNLEASLLSKYPNIKINPNFNMTDDSFKKYATVLYCKIAEYWSHSLLNYDPKTNDRKAFILEEKLMSVMTFYTFARFSPFTGMFQGYINRLADTGIWGKIYNQWSTSQDQFETYLKATDRMLKFDELVSLWLVTIAAYLICMCVFIGEHMFSHREMVRKGLRIMNPARIWFNLKQQTTFLKK